jgi:hypothetical protein
MVLRDVAQYEHERVSSNFIHASTFLNIAIMRSFPPSPQANIPNRTRIVIKKMTILNEEETNNKPIVTFHPQRLS